jgi:vitamin B12 transporter
VRVVNFIVLVFLFTHLGLSASPRFSSDTTYTLDEVVVRSTRLHDFTIGTQIQKIDTSVLQHYRNQSMAELLSEQTAISVNSYGPNGLTSISTRGGGSEHTAVIWNGFNLRNPMNASLNFSELPVSLFDGLTIQYGGASTLFGSGATTCSIHLDNSLKFNKGFIIALGGMAGSYHTFNQSVLVHYSSGRFASATRFFYQSGKNDFKFVNTEKYGNPVDTLKNASYHEYAIMQQNGYRISTNSIIRADFWYQKSLKNIPALMSDAKPGTNSLRDENLRVALNFARATSKLILYGRSGAFSDQTIFIEPLQYPHGALSRSINYINEIETKYLITPKHSIDVGFNYTVETAESDNYNSKAERQRESFFESYSYRSGKEKFQAVVNSRQEIVDGSFIPLVYSAGVEYKILRNIHLLANASKNYMVPTLNNLFWVNDGYSSGNPDLKPESGYSVEAGTRLSIESGSLQIINELTCYWSVINNWIIWVPDSLGIYKPENYNTGDSKGIELKGSIETRNSNIQQRVYYLYTYVNAKVSGYNGIKETAKMSDLVYVPRHKANMNYAITYKKYSMTSSVAYYGKRYYDVTKEPLDAYVLIGVTLERMIEFGNHYLDIYLKINNITNARYQVMHDYAMPPRNFMLGINLKLKK